MGAPLNPSMMLLGWQAQGLEYDQQLARNLSSAAYVLPIMHAVGESAVANIVMPGQGVLGELSDVYIEARMACQGSFDRDCDVWDHVHSLVRNISLHTSFPSAPLHSQLRSLALPDKFFNSHVR